MLSPTPAASSLPASNTRLSCNQNFVSIPRSSIKLTLHSHGQFLRDGSGSSEWLILDIMKRKLDENDAPTVEVASEKSISFEAFDLDPRLLQAVSKSQYADPTPVQAKAIPLALDGKDILAQSKTGSGKTAAYVLPTVQAILRRKASSPGSKQTSVLVLVPTRELADQVQKVYASLCAFCPKDVRAVNLTHRSSDAVLNAVLSDSPEVVVSTPGRVCQFMLSGKLSLDQISHLVIDEADLVLSYGYENDMQTISQSLPRGIQSFLMSATLTSDVDSLKSTFCRDPVTIKIEDKEDTKSQTTQYIVKCGEDEKFLLIFVIFKLRLIRGKTIVFVADIDRSYRLKLYLEQFGIKSCVLNSELPINTRLHIVQEFNKGLYDILIAADDTEVIGGIAKSNKAKATPTTDTTNGDLSDNDDPPNTTHSTTPLDYGISRGLDFHEISTILNFDLPTTSKSYTHRIGRTARAGHSGTAISFIIPPPSITHTHPPPSPSTRHDEAVLAKITTRQSKLGHTLQPWNFDMTQVNAFRYRMNDALRAVTRSAIRDARARELRQELIKSEKLRSHFEENPEELRFLRHDAESGRVRTQAHLRHVPDYLVPSKARKGMGVSDVGYVGFRKDRKDGKEDRKTKGKKKFGGRKKMGRKDPLKSLRR